MLRTLRKPAAKAPLRRGLPTRKKRGASASLRTQLGSAVRKAYTDRSSGVAAYLCLVEADRDRPLKVQISGNERLIRKPPRNKGKTRERELRAMIGRRRWDSAARVFAALGSPHRLIILFQLLGDSGGSHRSLAARTRLRAGPLYHHLDQLRLARLVDVPARDRYQLTRFGRRVALGLIALTGFRGF